MYYSVKIVRIVEIREGNTIMFPVTTPEVADPCSGNCELVAAQASGRVLHMSASTG